MTVLLALFVADGLLLVALSVPLILRRVGPNPWYGFRVRRTLDDPALWYPVNALAAKGLLPAGLGTIGAHVLLYCVPGFAMGVYAWVMGGIVLTGLALNVLVSFLYLKSLSKQKGAE